MEDIRKDDESKMLGFGYDHAGMIATMMVFACAGAVVMVIAAIFGKGE